MPWSLSFYYTSLLGEGYTLEELLAVSEEVSAIRESRQAAMKGRFDSFMKVFNLNKPKPKPTRPRIVAAKLA
jgi:hypothetical protein